MFRELASDGKTHSGELLHYSEIWHCSDCSSLWRFAKSNYCKTSSNRTSMFDPSIATAARNERGLLEPTELLFKFAEWVLEQFLHILSLSFIRLSSTEIMIQSVNNSYERKRQTDPRLPMVPICHPVAKYIIKKIGRRILSEYCSRLSKKKQSRFIIQLNLFYNNYINIILFADYKLNPPLPSAGTKHF